MACPVWVPSPVDPGAWTRRDAGSMHRLELGTLPPPMSRSIRWPTVSPMEDPVAGGDELSPPAVSPIPYPEALDPNPEEKKSELAAVMDAWSSASGAVAVYTANEDARPVQEIPAVYPTRTFVPGLPVALHADGPEVKPPAWATITAE